MFVTVKPKFKRTLQKILPFGVIWFVMGVVFLFVEMAATGYRNLNPDSAITLTVPVLVFALLAVMLVGFAFGYVETVFLERRFRKYSLGRKVLYKLLLYLFFLYGTMLITFPVAASLEIQTNLLDPEVWNKFRRFITSVTFLSTGVQIGFSILLCLLYAAISENLGHQVLLNFFTGKYHKPVVENRIFMFLDMKSSTTIAEKIGHVAWFDLLDKYYDSMSDPIIEHLGEVYQYIGDEVVVTWKLEDGLKNQNCLRCFFAIKDSLGSRKEEFMHEYGVAPDFRAGIHFGEVTTGEIGALKKEIIYTGDVLNTTARIQGLGKQFDRNLMVSEDLINRLPQSDDLIFDEIGIVELRGRSQSMNVYAVHSKDGVIDPLTKVPL